MDFKAEGEKSLIDLNPPQQISLPLHCTLSYNNNFETSLCFKACFCELCQLCLSFINSFAPAGFWPKIYFLNKKS
jgi:hypothetical protein